MLFHIHKQHFSGVKSFFFYYLFGFYIINADLRRKYYGIVGCYIISCRAQTVSVKRCSELSSVGEGYCGRTVPRLGKTGVISVKITL